MKRKKGIFYLYYYSIFFEFSSNTNNFKALINNNVKIDNKSLFSSLFFLF